MPKEELVEGIRQALSKGEPLEKAMMSFYSAGYKKEDIEEAAAAAQSIGVMLQPAQQLMQTPAVQPAAQPVIMAPPRPQIQPGVVQRVSGYGPRPNRASIAITIVLAIILILLVGILTAVILFKDEISGFFGDLMWRALI